MTPPNAHARDLPKPQVSAQKGALLRTLVSLWPYIWPSDRADLKMRVAWARISTRKLARLFIWGWI